MASTSTSSSVNVQQYLAYPQTPWKVSDSLFQRLQNTPSVPNITFKKCEVLPTDPEWLFIYRLFFSDQPTNQTIKKAYCIHNSAASRQFEGHISNMEKESLNPFFTPMWKNEPQAPLRQSAIDRWRQATAPYSPLQINWGKRVDKFTHTKVLPLWHGSDLNKCISVANTGFTFFGNHAALKGGPTGPSTDIGFFGKGIYFTDSAFYAGNIYANGHLLLAWVSMREPYPVVADHLCMHPNKPSDMRKLEGLGAYENYNAHYIPVVSIYPNNEYCGTYYPCTSTQKPRCDEVVVFSKSQTLARFWIEIEPEMTKPVPANASILLLKQVIDLLQEQVIKDNPRLLKFFQDKQQMLVAIGPAGTLALEEQGFFHWIGEFFDTAGKAKDVSLKKFTAEAFPDLTYSTSVSVLSGGIYLNQAHPEFFGRETLLQELEAALLPKTWHPSHSTLVKILVGPGGIGKTETAIKFGNDHIDNFSLVWTLHCKSAALFDQDVRDLADTLKIKHKKKPLQEVIEEVNEKLESGFLQKPFLLILDNVIEEPPLPKRGGAVLMTTNSRHVWPYLSAFIDVSPFSFEDVQAVILKVDPTASQKDIRSVHSLLDGSPLLLFVAVHYMMTSHVSLSRYLNEIDKHPPLFEKTNDNRYAQSLAQVYQLTLDRLEQADPQAFAFLQFCAYLNPDRIQPTCVELIEEEKGKKSIAESSSIEGNPLSILENLSLLRYDCEKHVYIIHRNLQLFLQKNHEIRKIQRHIVNQVILRLNEKIKVLDKNDVSTLWIALEYSTHFSFLLDSSFALQIDPDLQIADSWNDLGIAWNFKGDFAKAIEYFERALKMRLELYGEKPHPDIASSCNNLGEAWLFLGKDDKAVEYYERALKMRLELYGEGPHPHIAASWSCLGKACASKRDFAKAIEYFERALKMRLEIYGEGPHPDIAGSWSCLGNAWSSCGKDDKTAVEYHEKALKMQLELYGEETPHPDIAASWKNLGNAWACQGVARKSKECYANALKIFQSIYGEEPHPDMAKLWNDFGTFYDSQRDFHKGREYYEKAYRMSLLLFGEDHVETRLYKKNLENIGSLCSLL